MLTASEIASSPTALIEAHFGVLQDYRAVNQIEHKLIDMIIITIRKSRGSPSRCCSTIHSSEEPRF
jgi:hypothetical protein